MSFPYFIKPNSSFQWPPQFPIKQNPIHSLWGLIAPLFRATSLHLEPPEIDALSKQSRGLNNTRSHHSAFYEPQLWGRKWGMQCSLMNQSKVTRGGFFWTSKLKLGDNEGSGFCWNGSSLSGFLELAVV